MLNIDNEEFIPGETSIRYAGRVYDEKEKEYLLDAVDEFWLTYGKWSKRFEKEFSKKLNIRFSLLVNSGSSANLLAFSTLTSPSLKERQIKRGDEVITVAACFPTTISPIIQYGAIPVFVDVEEETANVDCTMLEEAYSNKTKAVILAHTLGNPFNVFRVKEFCNKHNLWLIEDNCDALGSKWNGKYTGTFGDIGTSSFYPAHHMTTGEGGMVYMNDPMLHKIALSIRDWGRDCWCESGKDNTCGCRFTKQFGKLPIGYDHKYVYSHFGYNLKATEFQAAIGCAQLEKLDQFVKTRKYNFQYFKKHVKNIKEIKVIDNYVESDPSWFGILIQVKSKDRNRTQLTEFLENNKIQTRNLFSGNILRHPCFESLESGKDYIVIGDLINTDKIMNDYFWIGVYPGMTIQKLDYIINKINKFFQK